MLTLILICLRCAVGALDRESRSVCAVGLVYLIDLDLDLSELCLVYLVDLGLDLFALCLVLLLSMATH